MDAIELNPIGSFGKSPFFPILATGIYLKDNTILFGFIFSGKPNLFAKSKLP